MESPIEHLAQWVGRREAFAAVAGRCSAAEAQSLRRIRDEKLYKELGLSWDEFCSGRLGASRRQIDRTLRLLDEFGPAYFHVAQMAHVTADEYRAIAPHVGEDGIRVDGSVIALLPENSAKVSAAVAKLARDAKPAAAKHSPDLVARRCEALAQAIQRLERPVSITEKAKVSEALRHVLKAAASKGVMVAP